MFPIQVLETYTAADYSSVITAVQNYLTSANLTSVLADGAGIAVVFVLLWWSVRKVSGMLMRAFKKGKLRI